MDWTWTWNNSVQWNKTSLAKFEYIMYVELTYGLGHVTSKSTKPVWGTWKFWSKPHIIKTANLNV